jgi:hypothetical protein
MRRERQSSTFEMRERVAKEMGGGDTESRRKGDKLDERDMEDEREARKGEGWGIGIRKGFFCEFF